MDRKKKIKIIQINLLVIGLAILIFTYLNKSLEKNDEILSADTKTKIKKQLEDQNPDSDIFYNIEYNGLDLAGNRYVLKSSEAYSLKSNKELINMKSVEAIFYFKDDTILKVKSETGTYNNKTLDMKFDGNVEANYEGSQLLAQKAEYSNSESFLKVSEKVKIKDLKGTMVADELVFDIKNQKLNINSFNDDKINANVMLKWKKDLEFSSLKKINQFLK